VLVAEPKSWVEVLAPSFRPQYWCGGELSGVVTVLVEMLQMARGMTLDVRDSARVLVGTESHLHFTDNLQADTSSSSTRIGARTA